MGLGTVVEAARNAGFDGDDLVTAIAVALAESSGKPGAVNTANSNGSTDYGLWQINSVHEGSGFKPAKALDPNYNARWAHRLFEQSGWEPWVAYKTGKYKDFLAQAKAAVQKGGASSKQSAVEATADAGVQDPSPALAGIMQSMSELVKAGRADFDAKGLDGFFAAVQGGEDDGADPVESMRSAAASMSVEEMQAAQDERRAAEEASGEAGATAPSTTQGGTMAWGGHRNGRIDQDDLYAVEGVHYSGEATHYFAPNAGKAFEEMVAAAARDGVTITLTDSYRDYATQVRLNDEKGAYAATPGTSNHGWGKAIDVASDEARRWVQQNGAKYGWVWPSWAHDGKGTEEDWHFEFRPTAGRRGGQ